MNTTVVEKLTIGLAFNNVFYSLKKFFVGTENEHKAIQDSLNMLRELVAKQQELDKLEAIEEAKV